jgi:hypothetical protein
MTRWTLPALAACAVVAVSGCAAPSTAPGGATAAAAEPARPMDLPVVGFPPCDLLTDAQRIQLGLQPAQWSDGEGGPPNCGWSVGPIGNASFESYSVGAQSNAELSDVDQPDPTRLSIDGFTAVSTKSFGTEFNEGCAIFIDVAQKQLLQVDFGGIGQEAGMTHQIACAKAQQFGQLAIGNLKTKLGK